ncbi:HAMP domain-containing histidine kinase [Acholeplasma equirhinis]|uniref:sensor histidine kinase n=1 Tax=Acholeplasma equirhinis TaxID=555393 RepID=UPI00197AB630|nr:HAMP domain-containing sensor histidine kinase [Acholeplasma equirhinis]MBN3491060.1 HAMP domain-containing histidine kinase [Acholeplasma equirhinis]
MNQFKLTTQINIIFSFVSIMACVVFLFVLNLSFARGYENQNAYLLSEYYKKIKSEYDPNAVTFNFEYESMYNDFFIIMNGDLVAFSNNVVNAKERNNIINLIKNEYFLNNTHLSYKNIEYTRFGNYSYLGEIIDDINHPRYAIIVISNTQAYINELTGNVPFYTTLAFINILALGMIIIWLWSSNTVKKLNDLKLVVDKMVQDNYQTEIAIDSAEEISSLAKAIDNMRVEIKNNEDTKKEMIQNLGHDLKTPIAVIKSYAEAILDGIEDSKSAELIIKQADVLNNKVKQIIEYSKIGYIDLGGDREMISMKEIIEQVVNHYKYLTQAKFIVDIKEDWKHRMVRENIYVAISNIVDNAVRYVQTKIVIQLKSKKLTIYNDGEQIDEALIPKIFKAYEKGSKGQFGLGLAIVKETLDRFNLKCEVTNYQNGVLFTIEPQ